MNEREECCRNCEWRYDIEKLDYSQKGCKHTKLEGFACVMPPREREVNWMFGIDEDGMCEMFTPRKKKQDCGSCKWLSDNFTSACVNGESEHVANFVDNDSHCEKWKGKADADGK